MTEVIEAVDLTSCPPWSGTRESDWFITADGYEYLLGPSGGGRVVVSKEGTGMPPIDYITQRGPAQHGETVLDHFLRPRVMQYHLRQRYGSRTAYWAGRELMLSVLRPNRGQGVLRTILPNGALRDIKCYVDEGPGFSPRDTRGWAENTIHEVVRFVAHNPVFYDPQSHDVLFIQTGGFTFPITFPITFTPFGFVSTIVYDGNWPDYPTVTVTGPLTSMILYNHTTGESISLVYTLAVGQSAIFDLSDYAVKRVVREDNVTNIIGSASGDISTFHLQPGGNNLEVTAVGSGAATSVTVQWYNRYIGV